MLKQYLNDGTFVLAKPAAQEYDGTGLPPVGCKCDYLDVLGRWHVVEITAHARLGVCFVECGRGGESYDAKDVRKFRPIRSQAERERESIIKLALERLGYDPFEFAGEEKPIKGKHEVWDSLNYLYDLGMLRMPDEDVAKKARGEL
jgi:hypothetical protein